MKTSLLLLACVLLFASSVIAVSYTSGSAFYNAAVATDLKSAAMASALAGIYTRDCSAGCTLEYTSTWTNGTTATMNLTNCASVVPQQPTVFRSRAISSFLVMSGSKCVSGDELTVNCPGDIARSTTYC